MLVQRLAYLLITHATLPIPLRFPACSSDHGDAAHLLARRCRSIPRRPVDIQHHGAIDPIQNPRALIGPWDLETNIGMRMSVHPLRFEARTIEFERLMLRAALQVDDRIRQRFAKVRSMSGGLVQKLSDGRCHRSVHARCLTGQVAFGAHHMVLRELRIIGLCSSATAPSMHAFRHSSTAITKPKARE